MKNRKKIAQERRIHKYMYIYVFISQYHVET